MKINEDVTIPNELSQQYLSVKKQISDKEGKKDQLQKQINQVDSEINTLQRNLIAIETKAAQMNNSKKQQAGQNTGQSEQNEANESINYMGNDTDISTRPIMPFWESSDEEDEDILTYDDIEELDDRSEYVFHIRTEDEDGEIIAKIYKDYEEDDWTARVVKGNEDPLEDMQFSTELDRLEIIGHLADIYGEGIEIIDPDEYESLLDDKEDIDEAFYGIDERINTESREDFEENFSTFRDLLNNIYDPKIEAYLKMAKGAMERTMYDDAIGYIKDLLTELNYVYNDLEPEEKEMADAAYIVGEKLIERKLL